MRGCLRLSSHVPTRATRAVASRVLFCFTFYQSAGLTPAALPAAGALLLNLTDLERNNDMPKFAANLTMLFNEVPFMERFAAAAKAGFKGVEYLFPYPFPAEELAKQLSTHGLTQVLHNLPAGNWEKGERGIAIFPDRVDEFKEGVKT